MKTCKKCSAPMKTWHVIDGIRRNFKNRKFCLDCSPFGLHNTQDLTSTKEKISKNESWCLYSKKRRAKHLEMAMAYAGGKCSICGYSKCTAALEFHHVDPSKKSFQISHWLLCKWDTLKSEIDKCILLCANCHREVEYQKIVP